MRTVNKCVDVSIREHLCGHGLLSACDDPCEDRSRLLLRLSRSHNPGSETLTVGWMRHSAAKGSSAS